MIRTPELENEGWLLDRARGDHPQYVHPDLPQSGTITVPGHPGDDLPVGTLNSILKKARAEEMKRYAVVFEKASRNWAAYIPDLAGCVTTGSTVEEARRLIAEAIEFHIESMRLRGESVPEPTSVAETVEIRAA